MVSLTSILFGFLEIVKFLLKPLCQIFLPKKKNGHSCDWHEKKQYLQQNTKYMALSSNG